MIHPAWFIPVFVIAAAVWVAAIALRRRRRARTAAVSIAIADFHVQREHLEARFCQLGALHGQSFGWFWRDCDFEDEFVLACKRGTGSFRALVRVTIVLERIVDENTNPVEPETRVQAATAIFLKCGPRWTTEGRVVFDLDPEETVDRFSEGLERIG